MSSFRSMYMYIQCTDLIHLQWLEHRFMILTSFYKTSVFHLRITIFRLMVATVCFLHVSITITSHTFQCKIRVEQEEMPCQPFHSCLLEPFHSDGVLTFFLSRFRRDLARHTIVSKGASHWGKCIFLKFSRGGIYRDHSNGIRAVASFSNCLQECTICNHYLL